MSTEPAVQAAGIPTAMSTGRYSHDELARLVDEAASFHLLALPAGDRPQPVSAPGRSRGAVGVRAVEALHRFDLDLDLPSQAAGVRGANTLGERAGRLDLRFMVIPWGHAARPDREPPPEELDRSRSQRFALQEATFGFGGGDGFRSFGTGRTFPAWAGGRPQLTVAAVGNLIEGFGRLRGCRGNFTLCGELRDDLSFVGHIMVRILDPDGALRVRGAAPPAETHPLPDPGVTYLTWIAQKGQTADQENYFSFTPRGQIRGANIPVAVKRVFAGLADAGSLRVRALETGEVIAREVGFGRETQQRGPGSGTDLSPYQFEGVSEYSFFDRDGSTVGAFKANFLEGRSFETELPGAPGQSSLRFSYYGAVTGGTGSFQGAQGMLYGTAGSVFNPPPSDHVISNLYVARLHDPDGRFRAARPAKGT